MAGRKLRSKITGQWVTTRFGRRTGRRVGLNLLGRKARRRRRTYR